MNEIARSDRTADLAGRRRRGIETYARIFDVPMEDVPAAMAARVGPVFAEEAFLAAGGPAWSDPGLTDRERSLVGHIRLAQRNGLDYEALTAVMTLVTNYIGQARGSVAMEAVKRVAGPSPRTPGSGADAA
jgi:4-carboxymuconolactone decarboxylase